MPKEPTPGENCTIKAYSKGELKDMYGISYTTLFNWLVERGKIFEVDYYNKIRIFAPKEVALIFDKIGPPY